MAPSAGANWELFAAKGDPGPNTGVGAGSSSAPSISFSGDPDTGIFHPADNKIALVGGGELFLHSTGANNAGFGEAALSSLTGGGGNAAVGHHALKQTTNGGANVAVGNIALRANTTGAFNTAVGSETMPFSTAAELNTAIGYGALYGVDTGSVNTAVGASSLEVLTSGEANTAVGGASLRSMTTGTANVAIGHRAFSSATAGDYNVALGGDAGFNPLTPANSIFIGNAGLAPDTNTIKIGIQGTQLSTFIAGIRGRPTGIADAGAVLIDSAGQLGTINSSRRYKFDIETMADVPAMLGKLRPVTFRYKQAQNDGDASAAIRIDRGGSGGDVPRLAVFKDGQPGDGEVSLAAARSCWPATRRSRTRSLR